MHPRKAIRDAVVAALGASPAVAALAAPSPAIESGRVIPLDAAALPRVLVYLRSERSEGLLTVSPRAYEVEGELIVAYSTRARLGTTVSDDLLDLAAEALEGVLSDLEATRFGGTVRGAEYQGTELGIGQDGEQITATITIRYALTYERALAGPTNLADFATNVIAYTVGDAAADHPGDELTLPIV